MEGIWHSQSPRWTPTSSPKASPFNSPRASPCHTPGGSPSTTRRQSPDDLPPIPKPYNGNSSLLRHTPVDNATPFSDMDQNNELPPLPARNKRPNRPPPRNTASPLPNQIERKTSGSLKETARFQVHKSSLHRRTRSDDQLDKSYDEGDFEEVPPLQRSLSVTKNKCYEPIFNSSSAFLLPQISGKDDKSNSIESLEHSDSKSTKPIPNRSKLDPNRPVPLPPGPNGVENRVQRPNTLSVIPGSRPGSTSDSDAPTSHPTHPKTAQKNKIGGLVTPDYGLDCHKSDIVELDEKVELSPFDDEKTKLVEDMLKVNLLDDAKDGDIPPNRKQSDVYYPIESNNFVSGDIVSCHDFDNDDDSDSDAVDDYDAPVPVIHTPTVEVAAAKWSPVSSDEASTPSSEFAKYTETKDPFSDDEFFNRKGDVTEAPASSHRPRLLYRNGQLIIQKKSAETKKSHESIDSSASLMDLHHNQNHTGVSSTLPPLPSGRTGGRPDTSMKHYEEDYAILMSQGYSREDIRKALKVADNNFAIARNILKEFSHNK
uniref:UBA domain-containing protein n=3 Tax=Clytia hemisphaerica TaxID=252671 RepID=A0A7M5XMV4_9CNID